MLREDDSALRKDCYYGLNVFVSTDGVSYQTVNDVRLDKIESQNLEEGTGVFVRETYSAGLPSSAAYVRLVFIECAKIPGRGAADIIDRSNLHFLSKINLKAAHWSRAARRAGKQLVRTGKRLVRAGKQFVRAGKQFV
ncbi:MAG: hypothetical protein ACLSDO_01655 [Anaerotruncus colihominis]